MRLRTPANLATLATLVLPALLATSPAGAGDGVTEINHALALAGGVTSGDTPDYPIELFEPGSYRLTSNLSQPDPETDVIVVRAHGVTIDLNGFTIEGTNSCSGSPTACVQTGNGDGITAAPGLGEITANRLAVAVQNGTIRGVGGNGIHLFGGLISVDRVQVVHAGRNGIDTSNAGSITDCGVFQNGLDGIETTGSSTITGNRVWQNGRVGIETSTSFAGGVISGNVVHFNGREGIHVRGTTALVKDNNVSNSGDVGLKLGSTTIGYGDNVLSFNDRNGAGVQIEGGTRISTNICDGASC